MLKFSDEMHDKTFCEHVDMLWRSDYYTAGSRLEALLIAVKCVVKYGSKLEFFMRNLLPYEKNYSYVKKFSQAMPS